MSSKFDGFSRDDINKIQSTHHHGKDNGAAKPPNRTVLRSNLKSSTATAAKRPASSATSAASAPKPTTPHSASELSSAADQQTATQDISSASNSSLSTTTSSDNSVHDALHFRPLSAAITQPAAVDAVQIAAAASDGCRSPAEHPTAGAMMTKGVSLREFEVQLRKTEEENLTKKAMLYRVIEQRSQRTADEAKRLNDIKHELNKLESNLASDVALLRKQIDAASLRYMQSQDHFNQVESVYEKAKQQLQKAREKKELLTSHLCLIVTSNEDRKAQKLAELMSQIGLSNGDESTAAS